MIDPGLDFPKKEDGTVAYISNFIKNIHLHTPASVDELLYSIKDPYGRTALSSAMCNSKVDISSEFIKKASSEALSFACLKDPFALFLAADKQETEIFYNLVQKLSPEAISTAITLKPESYHNTTALHLALLKHATTDLKILLANINTEAFNTTLQIDADFEGTPLHVAAKFCESDLFIALVKKASVDAISNAMTIRGFRHTSLLYLALYYQKIADSCILLINKSKPEAFEKALLMSDLFGGWTLLHYIARDDKSSKILFFLTDKASLETIMQALSTPVSYKRTMLLIKKKNPFNFVYLIFVHAVSYLVCSRSDEKFSRENKDWQKLLLKLSVTKPKNYFATFKEHIEKNSSFWGGFFTIKYKDIRNLFLELRDIDSKVIKSAVQQFVVFLSSKLYSISDKNIKDILYENPFLYINTSYGTLTQSKLFEDISNVESHSYSQAMILFKADPKLIQKKSAQNNPAATKEMQENRIEYTDAASWEKQWGKQEESSKTWAMWQKEKKNDINNKEEVVEEPAPNIENSSL